MKIKPFPRFAFEIWADGLANIYIAEDKGIPISKLERKLRLFFGTVESFLFQFWWYV